MILTKLSPTQSDGGASNLLQKIQGDKSYRSADVMWYNKQSRARSILLDSTWSNPHIHTVRHSKDVLLNACQFISLIDCGITDRLIRYWLPITIQFENQSIQFLPNWKPVWMSNMSIKGIKFRLLFQEKNKHELFIEPLFYFLESSPYCNYELPLIFSRGRSCGKLKQLHRQTETDRLLCSHAWFVFIYSGGMKPLRKNEIPPAALDIHTLCISLLGAIGAIKRKFAILNVKRTCEDERYDM